MVLGDSFDAPKLVRNVKYQKSQKQNKIGNTNNLAVEVLECISMVESSDFVQQCSKTTMPNFICYTEDQRGSVLFVTEI